MSADDLARFIAERLDEHEQGAHAVLARMAERFPTDPAATGGHWSAPGMRVDLFSYDGAEPTQAEHIARHDPTHVLAFVAAGRAILEQHRPVVQAGYRDMTVGDAVCAACGDQGVDVTTVYAPCPTLRAFGAIWAGHPAWREEWGA